jgi:hypothetical protein
LQEEFPEAICIFTPTEKLSVKAPELVCGVGYDLIVDLGAQLSSMKRSLLKLCGPFSHVITTSQDLQLDPPDSLFLSQMSISLHYANRDALLKSGIYDGVLRNIVKDVITRYTKGQLKAYMSHNVVKLI